MSKLYMSKENLRPISCPSSSERNSFNRNKFDNDPTDNCRLSRKLFQIPALFKCFFRKKPRARTRNETSGDLSAGSVQKRKGILTLTNRTAPWIWNRNNSFRLQASKSHNNFQRQRQRQYSVNFCLLFEWPSIEEFMCKNHYLDDLTFDDKSPSSTTKVFIAYSSRYPFVKSIFRQGFWMHFHKHLFFSLANCC